MKVLFRVEALDDLDNHLTFIANENPVIAEQVGQRILSSIYSLEAFPRMGKKGRVADTYELVIRKLPYIVIYRLTNFVEVLAIFHTSQNPGKLKQLSS